MKIESEVPCRLAYQGNGVLAVQKPVPGSPCEHDPSGAHFRLVVHSARSGRAETEFVPGFEGLSFDLDLWRAFVKGREPTKQFTYPEWSCRDYLVWRTEHQDFPEPASPALPHLYNDRGNVVWCADPGPGRGYFEHSLSIIDSLRTAWELLGAPERGVTLFCGLEVFRRLMRLPHSRLGKSGQLDTLDLSQTGAGCWRFVRTDVWPMPVEDADHCAFLVAGDASVGFRVTGGDGRGRAGIVERVKPV